MQEKLNPLQGLLEKIKGPNIAEALIAVKKFVEGLQSKNQQLEQQVVDLTKEAKHQKEIQQLFTDISNKIDHINNVFQYRMAIDYTQIDLVEIHKLRTDISKIKDASDFFSPLADQLSKKTNQLINLRGLLIDLDDKRPFEEKLKQIDFTIKNSAISPEQGEHLIEVLNLWEKNRKLDEISS